MREIISEKSSKFKGEQIMCRNGDFLQNKSSVLEAGSGVTAVHAGLISLLQCGIIFPLFNLDHYSQEGEL